MDSNSTRVCVEASIGIEGSIGLLWEDWAFIFPTLRITILWGLEFDIVIARDEDTNIIRVKGEKIVSKEKTNLRMKKKVRPKPENDKLQNEVLLKNFWDLDHNTHTC